jgi:hypothetical protein
LRGAKKKHAFLLNVQASGAFHLARYATTASATYISGGEFFCQIIDFLDLRGQAGFQLLHKGFRVKIGNLERALSFFVNFLIFAELKHCGRV